MKHWYVGERCEVRPVPGTGPIGFDGPVWVPAYVTRPGYPMVEVELAEHRGSMMVADVREADCRIREVTR